jgi:MFS superfamily sulfate permease-like transporter
MASTMHKALRMVAKQVARTALRSPLIMGLASAAIALPVCTGLAIALYVVWKDSP